MSEEPVRKDVVELPTSKSRIVTDELNRILALLKEVSPKESVITFDFDGVLEVHVDVRSYEDMLKMEGLLPGLGGGMFCCTERGNTPNRPFFHRITAKVEC